METKDLWVHFTSPGWIGGQEWYTLVFYSAEDAPTDEPLDNGDITVGPEGAMIHFHRYQPAGLPAPEWTFHELVIHPLGPKDDKLDISWRINDDTITVLHQEAAGKRKYSYTLSIWYAQHQGGFKFYFDPQIVDTGGQDK